MDVLDLWVTMMPSINQKHRVNTTGQGGALYIPREYKAAMKQTREDAEKQVMAARWRVCENDRYTVVSNLPIFIFTQDGSAKPDSDNHNPWKPMIDELVKAGVFQDDRYIEQEILTRVWETNPRKLLAHFRIYKFPYKSYRPAPALALIDEWYKREYTHV